MEKLRTGRWSVAFRFFAAMLACGIFGGCASGGFMTTRAVAKWLNGQNIVLRILLYIFIWPVFLITMLGDEIIFNTIDFWSGHVSAQNQTFEKDGTRVQVAHSRTPLRRSVFTIDGKDGDHTVIELRETASGSIEVYKNGAKRTEVKDIDSALPTFISYQNDGLSPARAQVVDLSTMRDLETLPAKQGYAETVSRFGIEGVGLGAQLACSK